MAKNMTRKGLALGAAASLIAAGFAGTPAYAAFATLDASFGTKGATQNGLLGQTFNLAATSDTPASAKFYVTGASAAELEVAARVVVDLTAADSGGTAYANLSNPVTLTDGVDDMTDGNDKAATVDPVWTTAGFAQMKLGLASSVTATRTITITPFLDTVVADGKITAGEVSGTPVTLTFHKASEVTATTTLDAVTVGGEITAKVVVDKSINMASIGGGVNVYFAKNGADEGVVQTATYSSIAAAFTAKASASNGGSGLTATANAVYSAQARLGGTASANNSGSAAVSAVTAGKIEKLAALAVDKGTSYAASANSSTDVVRAGSGTFTVWTEAFDSSTPAKAVAGQPVTFKISETGAKVDSGATITAGGKTLSGTPATAQDFSVTVTTDADGYAELVISYAGLKDANQFTVAISATGSAGAATAVSGSLTKQFTAQDSAAATLVDLNKLGGPGGNDPVHTTTVGGPISIAYRLVDQFGQTPVGTFRVKVATAATGGTINSTLPVSGGAATLSISDNSDAATSYNAVATVEKQNTNLSWSSATGTVTSAINVVSAIAAPTRVTVTEAPDSTATANLNALAAAALATVDARLSASSATLPTIGSNSLLSGVVYGANGAAVAGATVTLSAPGVMFVTDATTGPGHYSLGSTTIKTGSAGTWGDVAVLSTVSGKHTVTVTSGSGTTTTDVFFAAAAGNTGSKVTITAPAAVLPGSTLQVSAVVTDKFGNPVDTTLASSNATVAVSYTGPGLIVGNLPTETDSTGKITFNVLLGNNDRGNISMTVTYRPAGAAVDVDNVSSTATVVVGTVAAAQSTSVKRTGNSVAVRVTGYAKSRIVLNGVRVASRSTLGTLSRNLTLRAGRNVIQIEVDGQVIRTVRYTR